MRRGIPGLALAAAGALLLMAPAAMASATSPIQVNAFLQPEEVLVSSWSLDYREAKASQMTLVDALRDARWPAPAAPAADEALATQAIDSGSRYDGKRVPI